MNRFKLNVFALALMPLMFAEKLASGGSVSQGVAAAQAAGKAVRKVNIHQMLTTTRSRSGIESLKEAPLPRPIVSTGSEEVNGETLTVINIKLFGRPVIVEADAYEIKDKQKVLTGAKTLRLRLADTRSGVPMMQQIEDASGEVINDRVQFTLPNPDIADADFNPDNPEHWLVFSGVIQARAYGKLESDVKYRQKATGQAGFTAPGGQTARTELQEAATANA